MQIRLAIWIDPDPTALTGQFPNDFLQHFVPGSVRADRLERDIGDMRGPWELFNNIALGFIFIGQ